MKKAALVCQFLFVFLAFVTPVRAQYGDHNILIYVLSDHYEDDTWTDWYRNPSHLDGVTSDLRGLGFSAEVIDRKSDPFLPTHRLPEFSQVWISECDQDGQVETSPSEVAAILAFSRAGGGIWLSMEGTFGQEDWKEDVLAYAEPFGCTWLGNHSGPNPRPVAPSTHSLLQDLTWLRFNGEVGKISSTTDTLTVLWEYAPDCAGIMVKDGFPGGMGRLVIDSGWALGYSWWDQRTNDSLEHGNLKFNLNVAEWLEPPKPACVPRWFLLE